MTALDTNVLARFVLRDDAAMAAAAERLLAAKGQRFFVGDLVLAELFWLLHRVHGFSRQEMSTVLRAFTERDDFVVENASRVHLALQAFEAGGDFADELIHQRAREHGCVALATFDTALRLRHPDFMRKPA